MAGSKNRKIWRAPLAGLASVAMIATMGMAAATANASATGRSLVEITFDLNGRGTGLPAKQTLGGEEDYYINPVAAPTAGSDWTFTGWYTSPAIGSGEKVDFSAQQYVDTILYAHWAKTTEVVNVTFNSTSLVTVPDNNQNGNRTDDATVKLAPGDKLASWQKPVDDKADGVVVTSWGVNSANGADFDFSAAPTASVNLYAKTASGHTVTFTNNSGAVQFPDGAANTNYVVEVKNGDRVTAPTAVISNDLSKFDGDEKMITEWTNANDGNKTWNFNDAVTYDLTLNPNTTKTVDVYEVTYWVLGYLPVVISPPKAYVAVDHSIPLPTIDDFGGRYVLNGWTYASDGGDIKYEDAAVQTVADEHHQVALVMSAMRGTATQVTMTFDPNYTGSSTIQVKTMVGDYVDAPDAPVRDGYKFEGWFKADGTTKFDSSARATASDDGVTYYAKWSESANVGKLKKQLTSYPFAAGDADSTDYNAVKLADVAGDFTADSWTAFNTALSSVTDKIGSGKLDLNDSSFGADEEKTAGEVYDALIAAESKLVQTTKVTANVYRVYNPGNGDHVYAFRGEAEGLGLIGQRVESPNFSAVSNTAKVIPNVTVEVYRVYDKNSGEHLNVGYDEGLALVEAGWSWDNWGDPMFYVPVGASDVALYRVYNPNATDAGRHVYAPEGEASDLVARGYVYDNYGKPVYTFTSAK